MNRNNYFLKGFLTLLVVGIFGFANAQSYCTTNYTSTGWTKITNIKLAGSSVTLDNPSTACNGYEDFTSSVSTIPDLASGASYTLEVGKGTCSGGWEFYAIAWIDYNQNFVFDANEELGRAYFPTFSATATVSIPFTVACGTSGNTRLRVSVHENSYAAPCSNFTYGQAEDYTVSISTPSGLSSDFFVPDTSFQGTTVNFINSNQTGYISHNWTINGVAYASTNVTEIFGTPGTYTAKLVSENCLGKDSTTKTFVVATPTLPPVADFVSTKSAVEIFEPFEMIDLSTNGATYWDWSFNNGVDTIDGDDQAQLRGGNPFLNKNPFVNTGNYVGALDVGTWEVCLKASNIVGSSTNFCKMGYVTVQRTSFNMGPATSLPANIITSSSGTIFDKGGENNNYTVPESNLEALIAPCGAQSVTIDFSVFKLNANANLKVYDGVNALGTPLHSGTGFTAGNFPTGPLTANSGALYMLWNSSTGATDSGFAATWTSVSGTGAAPIANFDLNNGATLYNSVFLDILNTSQNAEGNTDFLWTISGPVPTVSYTTKDLENQVFTTNGAYTISLKVTGCDGVSNTMTKTFDVVAPLTPTDLDFTADNQRPAVGEDVTFTATSDKANRWEWNFFPPTGVVANAPASDNLNERSFKFVAPGSYTVQLRGFNTVDTGASETTIVKTAYIIVVQNCVPVIGVSTSTDVGISYVSIEDPSTSEIYENTSATGVAYTDFSSLGTIELNFGGTYNFEVERSTNVNPMSRKIWVDWNVDGDFDDAGELVASEATGNSLSWTGSFMVPANAFEANTTLRVGVSYNNDPNEPCGANSNPNANRIGEFEDYAIRVVNDGDIPTITLIDADTVYIEQNATPPYVTAGATALDPSQGDITANINMTTDVDQALPGIYYEVYTVMDASGNDAEPVTRVVYVVSDQTPPVITITGAADTTIEVGTAWMDLPASALDNKEGDLSDAIVTSGSVDFNLLGDYTITYSVQDNQGNASTATRIVRVVDTQLPVIENASADKSGPCWIVEVQLQNIFADITTATDNYNSLADNLTFTADPASPQGGAAVDTRFQGTTSVTYTATDESGNTTTQCVDYVVRDYIAPVIDLRTLDVINHRVNTPYVPVTAVATDNLYSSTQISLTATSTVDEYTLGTYTDTYTATDAAGNVSTKIRTVNIIDDISPVISGKNGGVVKLGVGSSVRAIDYINFSDDYDTPEDLMTNHTLIYNDLNQSEVGLYSVVFRTQDNSGNVSADYTLVFDVSHRYEVRTNSVEDIALEDLLTVAPNPTRGELNIHVNLPENEEINIAVYNTMGQQVVLVENGKVTNNSYTVNLNNQANGIYYVKMNLKGNIVTKKVILNK